MDSKRLILAQRPSENASACAGNHCTLRLATRKKLCTRPKSHKTGSRAGASLDRMISQS
jgi:hypothetical protein